MIKKKSQKSGFPINLSGLVVSLPREFCELFKYYDLSYSSFRTLLAMIKFYHPAKKLCFASKKSLMDAAAMTNRKTLYAAIKQLTTLGLIQSVRGINKWGEPKEHFQVPIMAKFALQLEAKRIKTPKNSANYLVAEQY